MTQIHETAIVDPSAELADDVVVGPYSLIEGKVSIGSGSWIGPHVVIRDHTKIGKDNRIFQFASVGEEPQYQGYKKEPTRLEIGDRNTIREYCTLSRGTAGHGEVTRIGDDNFLMAYVHIAHDCILGNHTIFANGSSLAGHVEVGDFAIMGGFSLVHQFCKVGAHCITGIGAICFQDVPPFVVAAGNSAKPYGINTKGLRRRDFSDETISTLKQAYRLLYRSDLSLKAAISHIKELNGSLEEITLLCDFLLQSERGIIR